MLQRLDQVLVQFIKYLERFHVALGKMGEYVLAFTTNTLETILRVLRRAISIVYRFVRDLITNLVKITWHFLQLALIPLFFTLLLCFGFEGWRGGYTKSGFCLIAIGSMGLSLFLIAFLASLGKGKLAETDPSQTTLPAGKSALIQFGFLTMNVLGLVLILYITFSWAYWFSNPVLRIVQVIECRVLLVVLRLSDRRLEGDWARATHEALGSPPIRTGNDIEIPPRIKMVEPKLSEDAKRPEAFGTVYMDLLVGSNGKVRTVKITNSVPLIDNEVKAAASQWEYKPSIIAGQPAPVIVPTWYVWAGNSLPADALAGINGFAKLENESLFSGTIKNDSKFILGWLILIIKGPHDPNVPTKWERRCEIPLTLYPGGETTFQCSIDKVDPSLGSRWDILAGWGLPSN